MFFSIDNMTQTSFMRNFVYFNADERHCQAWSYLSDVSYPHKVVEEDMIVTILVWPMEMKGP